MQKLSSSLDIWSCGESRLYWKNGFIFGLFRTQKSKVSDFGLFLSWFQAWKQNLETYLRLEKQLDATAAKFSSQTNLKSSWSQKCIFNPFGPYPCSYCSQIWKCITEKLQKNELFHIFIWKSATSVFHVKKKLWGPWCHRWLGPLLEESLVELANNTPIRFLQLMSRPYNPFIGCFIIWIANMSQHGSGCSGKRHFSSSLMKHKVQYWPLTCSKVEV